MIDCLIVGFNDTNFADYVNIVRAMGTDNGAYRDLNLYFVEYGGKPYRSMDILNHFHFQDKQGEHRPFNHADFLWPVILYLGTYLSRKGLSFDYVNLFHFEKDKLREKLSRNDILAVAITTTLYVAPHPILEIVSFVREYNPTARIIVGGPYILNQARMLGRTAVQELFKDIGADVYVIGSEGEFALSRVIRTLKDGSALDAVDNIAYRDGEDYVLTTDSGEDNSLEENMVDYGLFPREEIGEFVSLRTSKSCPFACAFCGFPERAGKYKYLDVALVEKELDAIRDIGNVTTLTFIDDTFNIPKKRAKEIFRMMIRNRYGFKWNCTYRCDHGDEETIELMKEAGCEGVFLGVESGSDDMLQRMNKTARRQDYLKAISKFREVGITAHANLLVGFPGETLESVQKTIELIEEAQPNFFRAQLWYCDPITPIWRQREKYGIRGSGFEWSHHSMDSRTACDLIERMFLSVENSIWLPQNGFELWSLFYLQRKGMTLERVENFVKCFNAIIKDKLIFPEKTIAPDLMDSLIKSCQFGDVTQPDMQPIQARSGANYAAAEKFWIAEFGDRPSLSGLELLREETGTSGGEDDQRLSVLCVLKRSALDSLRAKYQANLAGVFLAAYSVLLSRLSGKEDTTIVSALGGKGAVPLRLRPSWDQGFGELVQHVWQKAIQAAAHQPYAFHILTNPQRMKAHNAVCPVFDAGYAFRGLEDEPGETGLEQALRFYPSVAQGMGLVLEVTDDRDDIEIQFLYRPSWFKSGIVDELGAYLTSILETISENANVLVGDVALHTERKDRPQSPKIMILDRKLKEERDYWLARLSQGIESSSLWPDYLRQASYSGETDVVELRLPEETCRKLAELADGACSLYAILMAALKVCLHRYTGHTHVAVGSPALKRSDGATLSTNALVIVDDVDDRLPFRQLALNVQQTLTDAYARQRYPFARLVQDLGVQGIEDRCPLFDIALMMEDLHGDMPQVKNAITIILTHKSGQVSARVVFNKKLFKRDSLERFAGHWVNLLQVGLQNTDASICELQMLSEAERRQLLVEWDKAGTVYLHNRYPNAVFQDAEVYLLDTHLQPVPVGVPGELYIGGVGSSRGYLNHSMLTTEAFIPHPFGGEPEARLYKTGDMARYLPDGSIEFLGRADQRAKIGGLWVDLGEIETALTQHPAVKEAAVLIRGDETDDKQPPKGDLRLAAFVAPIRGQAITTDELRRFLQTRLPAYMLPSDLITMEALPLTPDGNIDRKVLLARQDLQSRSKEAFITPRTDVERTIAAIWQEVLHVDKVGVRDNFFDLGGSSILAVQAQSKLHQAFDKDISIADMFKYPTVGALAKYLGQEETEKPSFEKSRMRTETRRESTRRQREFRQQRHAKKNH